MPNFKRYLVPGAAYFVTMNVRDRKPLFREQALAFIITENLAWYRKRLGFKLLGYVIMPDHLHLILIPSETATLPEIMRRFKSFTGRVVGERLGTKGGIWQTRYYDRAIRNEDDLRKALEYIHNNPVVTNLVDTPGGYKFSSFGYYHDGDSGPIYIDVEP